MSATTQTTFQADQFSNLLELVRALRLPDFQCINSVIAVDSHFGACVIKIPNTDVTFSVMSERQNKILQMFAKLASNVIIEPRKEDTFTRYLFKFKDENDKTIGTLSTVESSVGHATDLGLLEKLEPARKLVEAPFNAKVLTKSLQLINEANFLKFTVNHGDQTLKVQLSGDDMFEIEMDITPDKLDPELPEEFFVQSINAAFLQPVEDTTFWVDDQNNIVFYQNFNGIDFWLITQITTEDVTNFSLPFER